MQGQGQMLSGQPITTVKLKIIKSIWAQGRCLRVNVLEFLPIFQLENNKSIQGQGQDEPLTSQLQPT